MAETSDQFECANCGKLIQTSMRYCVHCGHAQPPHPDQPEKTNSEDGVSEAYMKKLDAFVENGGLSDRQNIIDAYYANRRRPTGLIMDEELEARRRRQLEEAGEALKAAEKKASKAKDKKSP